MKFKSLLNKQKDNSSLYINESYSQEGEDGILHRIFEGQKQGFFIDIGAHHPFRFSNTYKFYKLGWRGINIDAMPGSMDAFKVARPEDINLEIPVSDKAEECRFFIFNEPALNTLSEQSAKDYDGKDNFKLEKIITIKSQRLDAILDQYINPGQHIKFMSIDAEGYDYKVLSSNNWDKYSPEIVLVESMQEFKDFVTSDIYKLMINNGYEFYAKTVLTYFFKRIS